MRLKVFSERIKLEIVKDKVGEGSRLVEKKCFNARREAIEYCKKRMKEIKAQELEEVRKIEYDVNNQFVGITRVATHKKDDLYEYFATVEGCCDWSYVFYVMKEIYLGTLGWGPRRFVHVPKDKRIRNKIMKDLEEDE